MRLFKNKNHEDPRRYVFIPIVKPGSNDVVESSSSSEKLGNNGTADNQLIEVYSQPYLFGDDTDNQAINKDWDRIAAALRKKSRVLFHSGSVATSKVHKLGLKRPRMAFYQWLKPKAWLEQQRLYSDCPKELSEGNSAELGLALVLLMAASGSPYRQVIATGALSGQIQLIRERDVEIQPVNNLVEKFKLVIQQVNNGKPPQNKNLLFFIPKYYDQEKTKRVEVESLPEVQTLRTLGIQVVPIEWLSEAAKKLKADTARYLPQDLIFKWLMIALLVISLSWVSWVGWRDRAISMAFVTANPETLSAEPFLVCFKDKEVHYQRIVREGIVPIVPTTSTLGWQIKIGEASSFDSFLSQWFGYQGYYVAYLIISQFSAPKINRIRIYPDKNWIWSWKLNELEEDNKLILLAQRQPFNLRKLERLVKPPESKTAQVPIDITKIANDIESQFPNGLYFTFKTASKSQCTF
jgi:hypothetical protein